MRTITAPFLDDDLRSTLYLCHLWRIQRADGLVTLRLTNHSQRVEFPYGSGVYYEPFVTLDIGDESKQAGDAPDNAEVQGVLEDAGFTAEDLAGGRWKLANITQYVVNWKAPWLGEKQRSKYTIQDITYDDEIFSAQVEGIAHVLNNKFGRFCRIGCPHRWGMAFGKPAEVVGCRADTTIDQYQGVSVSAVVSNRVFQLSTGLLPSTADGHYTHGSIFFETGVNEGIRPIDVDDYTDATRQFEMLRPFPFEVKVGDLVTVKRGCNQDWADCGVYDERDNYGGDRHLPTEEDLFPAPRSKA